MGYYRPDPYYNPEKFGLRTLYTIDLGGSYEFDMLVVWEHTETGERYFATDSGCSCPSPFETYESLDDLTSFTETATVVSVLVAMGGSEADVADLTDALVK